MNEVKSVVKNNSFFTHRYIPSILFCQAVGKGYGGFDD